MKKMASNIKSKLSSKESPAEPFKRAVTGCVRALARKPELEVSFAAERPGLMGGKVRLPEPPPCQFFRIVRISEECPHQFKLLRPASEELSRGERIRLLLNDDIWPQRLHHVGVLGVLNLCIKE